jgi:hypothetical protein
MDFRYSAEPHPHFVIDEIIPQDEYAALRFPDDLIARGEAWGITGTDREYGEVLRDPSWRSIHDFLRGEEFVRTILRGFAGAMRSAGCLVDPERARLVPFTESREEKERSSLACDADPNEIFTRLDFQSKAEGGYREFVHLDWARRIIGGILFFSDAEEEGLEGGELALYRDRAFRDDRWCHEPEITALFPPRRNTGVIFLNSNSGFHGPRAITALRGRRRWLYYTISSRADVWPCQPRVQTDGVESTALDR